MSNRGISDPTRKQHKELSHAWSQVDGRTQEVEGWGVLLHRHVHQTQVVEDLPVEWRQVVSTLEAADCLEKERITVKKGKY